MRSFFTSLLIILISSTCIQAQNKEVQPTPEKSFSIRIDRQSSGSGHLNFTTLGASYNIGRSSLYAGALLEDRNRKVRGMKVNYRFYPIAFGAKTHPYLQYQGIGRWGTRLTKDLERLVHKEDRSGERNERYRTFEHYLGFGIEAPLMAGAYVDLGIGMGIYHSQISSSFDDRIEDAERFRSDQDASLTVNAGLGYSF